MRLLLTTLVCLLTVSAVAQKTLQELADLDDKKFGKLTYVATGSEIVTTYSEILKAKKMEVPDNLAPDLKRVGLVTYFLVDESIISASAKGWSADYLTPEGSKTFVQDFYDRSFADMKLAFADQGIALLLPEEFITNEAQQDAYNNTVVEVSKLGKVALAMQKHLYKTSDQSAAVPPGFRLIAELLSTGGADMKALDGAGNLATGLGLDAILAVQITLQLDGNKLYYVSTEMAMHCPNPLPPDPNKNWIGKYYYGYHLAVARIAGKEPILIAKVHKKSVEDKQLEGYGTVHQRLTQYLLQQATTAFDSNKGGRGRGR